MDLAFHPDFRPQLHRINPRIIDIFAVNQNVTFDAADINRIIHPVDTTQESGLATTRGANKGRDRIGRDINADIFDRAAHV